MNRKSVDPQATQHRSVKRNHGWQEEPTFPCYQTCRPSATRTRADWGAKSTPQLCRRIISYPQPYRKNCANGQNIPGIPKCNPNHPPMFAQYGEDYFLYTRHFIHMKKPGIYLDIAANHPTSISNTYFLDRCLGWSGICFEANPMYHELLHRERSCALVPTCVSARDGEILDFVYSGPAGGIVATHRQGSSIANSTKHVERKRCVTVQSQLERYGHTVIDYLNLDVEGGEMNVLRGFDWNHTTVKLVSVEVGGKSEQEIDAFFKLQGFKKVDPMTTVNGLPGMPFYRSNKFYVHSNGQFGKPW